VVAGDHDNSNSGATAAFDSGRNLGTGRILEADETVEHEVLLEVL
jgi:hypothetical protein